MDSLTLDTCTVDLRRRVVHRPSGAVRLSPKEAALLAFLAERPQATVSRELLLREVWGYREGVVSRTLDTTVRTLRAKIEADRSTPSHVLTDPGGGYRFEPARAQTPPPPPPFRPPGVVREASAPIGLQRPLAELTARADEGHRLVTLIGVPGVGKSHIARHVVASTGRRSPFRAGAYLAPLADCASVDDVLREVAGVLSLGDDERLSAASVGAALGDLGSVLVVLDDADQVVAQVADLVAGWLDAAPEARFLVTSRERLRLRAEVCVTVEPLGDEDALALLQERARAAGLHLDDDARGVLAELARRLDGIPLALELAAARIGALGARGVLERLSLGYSFLSDERRDVHVRHTTLHHAIQTSWELLAPEARDAFMQCAAFTGTFDLAAARAVIDLSRHPGAPPVDQVLFQLAERCLVQRITGEDVRFVVFASLRSFARKRLEVSDRRDAVAARHAAWYAHVAEQAAPHRDAGSPPWWTLDAPPADELEPDRANLVAAMHAAAHLREPEIGVRLAVAALTGALPMPATTALALVEPLRQHAGRLSEVAATRLELLLGALTHLTGQPARARALLETALERALADGRPELAVDAMCALADVYRDAWRLDLARAMAARALSLASELGHPGRKAVAHRAAAEVELARLLDGAANASPSAVEDHLTQALAAARRARQHGTASAALRLTAKLYRLLGRVDAAGPCADDAMALAATDGLPARVAEVTREAGLLALQQGRLDDARARLTSALDHSRAQGAAAHAGATAIDLARVGIAAWLCQPDPRPHARGVLDVFKELATDPQASGFEVQHGREALVRGIVEALDGHLVVGQASLFEAAAWLTGRDPALRVLALAWSACVHAALGRLDAAEETLASAREESATPAVLRALAVAQTFATSPVNARAVDAALRELDEATLPPRPGAAEPLAAALSVFVRARAVIAAD